MAVWKQLALDAHKDEIYIVGKPKDLDKLTEILHRFVTAIYSINPSAEFNRHPLALQGGVPFDILTTLME